MISCAKPNPQLIPICILSGYREDLESRRQGCLETWIPLLDRKFCPVFVTGDPNLDRPWLFDPPFLIARCPDDYYAVPAKVQVFCAWALESFDLKWAFKCDDDSYIDTRLFNPFPFENWDWVGHFYGEGAFWKAHGAGYSLSRRCVEAIARHMPPEATSEDWAVSLLLREHVPDLSHHNLAWTPPIIAPWSGDREMRQGWMIGHSARSLQAHRRLHALVFRA